MNNKYAIIDLFAGVGGLSKAFQQVGAEIVYANEIDKYACSLYKENLSDVYLVEEDMRNIQVEKIPDFDILVAGFPYQSISVHGRYNQFYDKQNSLFYKIIRVLEIKKPRAFLLESVKGLISMNQGKELKILMKELEQRGYFIKTAVINSLTYGNIPHNKERLYLVGFNVDEEYKMFEFPEKIPLKLQINDLINITQKKENKYYYDENSELYSIIKKEVTEGKIYKLKLSLKNQYSSRNILIKDYEYCPAITSIAGKDYIPILKDNFGIRRLTPKECFHMQGFFDINISEYYKDYRLYKYAGNCSSVEVVKRIAENIFKTLDCGIQKNQSCNLNVNCKDDNLTNIKQQIIACDENRVIVETKDESSVQKKEIITTDEEINIKIKEVLIDTEREFTLQKVIPALRKLGFWDVRYNHGIEEYGKDVTYRYKDNFEKIKLGAAQVKYGDISGAANSDVDKIFSQIADAFNMPFSDLNENGQLYINQFLIICSGKYSKNAKEKIKEKFSPKDREKYDVRFFDGQDIDNFLKKKI